MHVNPPDTQSNPAPVVDSAYVANTRATEPPSLNIESASSRYLSSGGSIVFSENGGQSTTMRVSASRLPADEKWTGGDNRRFRSLVQKEALGEIEEVELVELEVLQKKRRLKKAPRSLEQILYEQRRDELLREIYSTLSKTIRFADAKNQ